MYDENILYPNILLYLDDPIYLKFSFLVVMPELVVLIFYFFLFKNNLCADKKKSQLKTNKIEIKNKNKIKKIENNSKK